MDSDIAMAGDDIRQLICLIEGDSTVFQVRAPMNGNVMDLKELIPGKGISLQERYILAKDLLLWKVDINLVGRDGDSLSKLAIKDSNGHTEKLVDWRTIATYWATQPDKDRVHIFIKIPVGAGRKQSRSPSNNSDTSNSGMRKWTVNGAIRTIDMAGCYYLDPGTQRASEICLNAVTHRQFLLLPGARASGKTTRLFWLQRALKAKGYTALYFSFERLAYTSDVRSFWKSIGSTIRPSTPMFSQDDFLANFRAERVNQKIVFLIDELGELYHASSLIRDEFLRACRDIRNDHTNYAIHSIIAAGTFSILYLNPTNTGISPFNVSDYVPNPYFGLDETRQLFDSFAQDSNITIDDDVVEDVWLSSNGHPGMVCLCGRVISDNLPTLLDHNSNTLSYRNWKKFPVETLYGRMFAYNTFRAMHTSLLHPDAAAASNLLRARFAGFLGDEQPHNHDEELLMDFLTAEGVLAKPDFFVQKFRVSSPFVDGFIRTRVLPAKFPHAPSCAPPCDSSTIHVLETLTESLKYFDKELVSLATSRSYKTPGVTIPGLPRVPRESVYDTELMRILMNWVHNRCGWTVTGQWHLLTQQTQNKYSNIVLKNKDNTVIVLELLATGSPALVRSHIEKTPEYMALLSAAEGWVVHFTCEVPYVPVWQSDAELQEGVNVVHFIHNPEFTDLLMSACWRDHTGHLHMILDMKVF